MERKDFLKGVGIAGVASILPFKKTTSAIIEDGERVSTCTLIPSETRGPYPLPTSTAVSAITRSDIRETKTGVLLTFTITVQNTDCLPIAGARVDIWHCDKDGYYSAYASQPGYLGTLSYVGATWLRGSQTTDSNGQVTFTTIYPGWYTSRVTHIHAEVYINSVLQRTSQFAFPDSLNNTLYTTSAFYTPHGTNTVTNSTDSVFSDADGVTNQLLTVTGSIAAGYAASHTFTITYALTLELLSFSAGLDNGKASLWWSTSNEINASHFEIERSTDAATFINIGSMAAKNTVNINSYSFIDGSITDKSYYRLKMVDKDGKYTYSGIVMVNKKTLQSISIYPNPVKDKLVLNHAVADANTTVTITSLDGRNIAAGKLQAGATSTSMNVNNIVAKGVYLLVVTSVNEKAVIKFIKD